MSPIKSEATDTELLQRALAGYFRAGSTMQPSKNSRVVIHDDHRYVVLSNVNGLLAVYRVRNDGVLKRLKRWPTGLDLPESPIDSSTDRLHQAVEIADRLIAKAAGAEKSDLKKLRTLIAIAGFELDSTDESAGEDLRAVWGLSA